MICRCRLVTSTTSKSTMTERADARGGEIERGRRTEAAGADAQHARRLQPPLPLLADFGQQQVTAVALPLGGREATTIDHNAPPPRLVVRRSLSPKLRSGCPSRSFCSRCFAAAAAAAVAWTVAAERRAADARRALDDQIAALAAARAALAEAQQAEAALRAWLDAEQRNAAEKLAVLEQARDALKDTFAAVSADLLAQNNTRFLDLAKEKLGEFQNAAAADLDVPPESDRRAGAAAARVADEGRRQAAGRRSRSRHVARRRSPSSCDR